MVFALQTETPREGKYSIAKDGQGSPFRLNHLADKAEKVRYGALLYEPCPNRAWERGLQVV